MRIPTSASEIAPQQVRIAVATAMRGVLRAGWRFRDLRYVWRLCLNAAFVACRAGNGIETLKDNVKRQLLLLRMQ
jgi:hypothetical protein